MGSSDIAPEHAQAWLVPASTVLLGVGVLCWDATYVLMTVRSLRTRSYGMPVLALAVNVSWEIVYGFWVTEAALERAGFVAWLALDVGLVWTTVQHAPREWARSGPWVGRHMAVLLALLTALGCLGHFAFAAWFLAVPGRGHGDKTGKWWRGRDGFDTTELAFWSAGISQLALSAGSVAMLLVRGHSGGTGYLIWFFRAIGSFFGMVLVNGLLWWYWPEAHSYILNPFAVFLLGTSLACDLSYPFVLGYVRRTEVMLSDGSIISGEEAAARQASHEKKA